MSSIAIIDYGMGNLHSIAKAVEHVAPDARVQVSSEAREILSADRVVFPGVGGIGHTMQELTRTGLGEVACQAAASKPMLCICVGMQALFERSEENDGTACLGLIPGEVKRFPDGMSGADGGKLKVPIQIAQKILLICHWIIIINGCKISLVNAKYNYALHHDRD